jgi:hypothetical protein
MPQPEYHSLRCPNSHGSVLLGFQRLSHTVNVVRFELVDCPTLHCPECGYSTLPGAIQTSLEKEIDLIKVCRVSWPKDPSPSDGGVYAER